MGKNMLHTRSQLLEMTGPLRQGLVLEERRLPQSLPDVAGATTVNGGVAVAADIYINKVSGGDLCLLQLHGQLIDNAPPVRFTVFLKRTEQTRWRLWRALRGSEVHHCLVEEAGATGFIPLRRQCGQRCGMDQFIGQPSVVLMGVSMA